VVCWVTTIWHFSGTSTSGNIGWKKAKGTTLIDVAKHHEIPAIKLSIYKR
jgi:hypothetical protein